MLCRAVSYPSAVFFGTFRRLCLACSRRGGCLLLLVCGTIMWRLVPFTVVWSVLKERIEDRDICQRSSAFSDFEVNQVGLSLSSDFDQ